MRFSLLATRMPSGPRVMKTGLPVRWEKMRAHWLRSRSSNGVYGFVAVGFEDDIFEVGDAGAGVGEADGVGMGFG